VSSPCMMFANMIENVSAARFATGLGASLFTAKPRECE
jgi:hypothetical protein